MNIVILTAFGVGGATMLGSVLGLLCRGISCRFSDAVLSFAAGVMLAASVFGLILPSVEQGGTYGLPIAVIGIFAGAVGLGWMDKLVPHLQKLIGPNSEKQNDDPVRVQRVLLFVAAIAIHNLPEGLAAGVGFGGNDPANALMIAGGIALQNIPEGMVLIGPMLSAGISPKKTMLCALGTGVLEIVGTLLGYFAVRVATVILPFALACAGGTMLFVISDEMIPETHGENSPRSATYALLGGFCLMLAVKVWLG